MPQRGKRAFWAPIMALALASVVSLSVAGEKNPSQNKAAVVNGSIITQADLKREMAGAQRRLFGMGKPLDDSQLLAIKKEAIKRLIERELLYQESQKKRIKVDETAVKEQLETLKKRFPSGAEFKNALSKMNLSEADVKSEFARGMAIQKLIDKEFVQEITVSDKEVKAYYDSNPADLKLGVGQQLEVRRQDGQKAMVMVTDVSESTVTLDANHPLAGKDLTFDIQLVEIV